MLAAFAATAVSHAAEKKFLAGYDGQTTAQLIALVSEYRIDSLVLAFEQAVEQKKDRQRRLSPPEMDILAVEAMEREVNNGGFHAFFTNSSKSYAALLPASLERIDCPLTAAIAREALAALKVSAPLTDAKIDQALQRDREQVIAALTQADARYFQSTEPLADRLFAYIKAHQAEIVLK